MLSGLSALGQLSLFLASLFMLWMILKVLLQFTQRKESGGENGHSGSKPVSYWQMEFRKAVKEGLEDFDQGRMDRFRELIRDVVREELDRR